MTDLVAIENAIVTRLQPLVATYNVAIGKLDANELNRPVQSHQIFVDYDGFKSEFPLTNSGQELRTYSYKIYVRFLNLQTHDLAYPLLGAIATALKNFKPLANFTIKPMRLLSEKPDTSQVKDGLWFYVQNYDFQILEV